MIPEHAPEHGFFVGLTHIEQSDGEFRTLYDMIDANGNFTSGFFTTSSEVVSRYASPAEWLRAKILIAQNNYRELLSFRYG